MENQITAEQLPKKFRPLSPWAYFGYSLLFSIPIVGFILVCIFALGGAKNVNLKNWCRSFFCIYILIIIAAIILVALGAGNTLLQALMN